MKYNMFFEVGSQLLVLLSIAIFMNGKIQEAIYFVLMAILVKLVSWNKS